MIHTYDFDAQQKFEGEPIYYTSHQFVIAEQALCVIMWNIHVAVASSMIDFWLNSIHVRSNGKASILLVATHASDIEPEYPSVGCWLHWLVALVGWLCWLVDWIGFACCYSCVGY